tara:strand:+ start:119 stop:400 length:282 start_codon:yes stop_codon:yes gene_type:complete
MKKNSNLGSTNLKRKRQNGNPILEYDRLPKELRKWIANAQLPWRPKSVLKAYERAYSRTSNSKKAMHELSRIQNHLVSKDTAHIWGKNHPNAK